MAPSIADRVSRLVPHANMRWAIAKRMLESVTTAPHVTALFEADFTAISRHRERHKAKMVSDGINLTYTSDIVTACVAAIRKISEVNSRWHGDHLEIFGDINIGVGIALGDKGLRTAKK